MSSWHTAYNSANKHAYLYIDNTHFSWEDAQHLASIVQYRPSFFGYYQASIEGAIGHLATITSEEEEAFIAEAFWTPLLASESKWAWIDGFDLSRESTDYVYTSGL